MIIMKLLGAFTQHSASLQGAVLTKTSARWMGLKFNEICTGWKLYQIQFRKQESEGLAKHNFFFLKCCISILERPSPNRFSWAKIEVVETRVYFIYLWDQSGMVWDGWRWIPRWLLQISLHFLWPALLVTK